MSLREKSPTVVGCQFVLSQIRGWFGNFYQYHAIIERKHQIMRLKLAVLSCFRRVFKWLRWCVSQEETTITLRTAQLKLKLRVEDGIWMTSSIKRQCQVFDERNRGNPKYSRKYKFQIIHIVKTNSSDKLLIRLHRFRFKFGTFHSIFRFFILF